MPHAEILLAPALMLADYYLTLFGARLFGATPEARATYELNPGMRGAVARLAPFDARHFIAATMATIALYASARVDPVATCFFLGVFVGGYGALIGNHVTNLLTLSSRSPAEAGGRISATYRRRLMEGAYRSAGVAIPLSLVAVMEPRLFTAGAASGAILVALAPLFWRLRSPKSALDEKASIGAMACGFCGADAARAKKLIAADAAIICDECVGTCVEALAEEAAGAAPERRPQ